MIRLRNLRFPVEVVRSRVHFPDYYRPLTASRRDVSATPPQIHRVTHIISVLHLLLMQVEEPALVRDVLSACQGISSDTVSCSTDANDDLVFGFCDRLWPPQQQLIARLCEFGWLFR